MSEAALPVTIKVAIGEGPEPGSENERRECTHFAAVVLEKRVSHARELWRRCTLDDHKADSSN